MLIFCGNFWRTHVGASFWGSEKKIKYGNALVLLKKSSRTIFPVPEAPKNKIWICVDFGRFCQFFQFVGTSWWGSEKAPRVGFEPTRDFGCPARIRAFGALPLDHSRACGFKGVHIAVMCGRTPPGRHAEGKCIKNLIKIDDFSSKSQPVFIQEKIDTPKVNASKSTPKSTNFCRNSSRNSSTKKSTRRSLIA